MEKRYNFRIYPNSEQERRIQKNFGCVRWVYNHFLDLSAERYKSGEKHQGYFENCLGLTKLKRQEEYKWLCEADASSLQYALKNLDTAYTEFFRRLRRGERAAGFPRFKSKKEARQSYKSTYAKSIVLGGNFIKLPKLGHVGCRVSKQLEGRVISANVSQAPSGKYYVSLCVTDYKPAPLPKTGKAAGLHLGVATLVSSSDGEKTINPKFMEKSEQKIAKLRRGLSRKTSGSANYEKARLKLARACESAKNRKSDYLHKLTTQLVRDYDIIYVTNRDFTESIRNKKFSKPIAGAGWGELRKQLEYKCGWYGKELVTVDYMFPSVQLCSVCGHIDPEIGGKRHLLKWDCAKCGANHDRAINAASNILNEGRRYGRAGRSQYSMSAEAVKQG